MAEAPKIKKNPRSTPLLKQQFKTDSLVGSFEWLMGAPSGQHLTPLIVMSALWEYQRRQVNGE